MWKNILILILLISNIILISINIKKGKFLHYRSLVTDSKELEESVYVKSKELEEHQKKEVELLKYFHNLCKKHEIYYFATAGTLLGAVRHNGFIPWDDDIDLAVNGDSINKLKELKEEMEKEGIFIRYAPKDNHMFKPNKSIHQLFYKDNEDIWLDLFEFEKEEGYYYHKFDFQKLYACPKEIFTEEEFENIKSHKFEDIEINIPKNPYKFLRRLFGEWERLIFEPNHKFRKEINNIEISN